MSISPLLAVSQGHPPESDSGRANVAVVTKSGMHGVHNTVSRLVNAGAHGDLQSCKGKETFTFVTFKLQRHTSKATNNQSLWDQYYELQSEFIFVKTD